MAIAKKKKRFFDVEIPIISVTTQLMALEQKELEGRIIKYDLTRILRGKNVILDAVVKHDGEKYFAVPVSIKIMINFLKRMVRKGTDYAEDSFFANAKDAEIEVKPLLVTRKKVPNQVQRALRQKAREELINYFKIRNVEDLFEDIMRNKLQKELSLKLKKIYPLSLCEIRSFRVVRKLEMESAKPTQLPAQQIKQTKEKEVSKKEKVKKEVSMKEIISEGDVVEGE